MLWIQSWRALILEGLGWRETLLACIWVILQDDLSVLTIGE